MTSLFVFHSIAVWGDNLPYRGAFRSYEFGVNGSGPRGSEEDRGFEGGRGALLSSWVVDLRVSQARGSLRSNKYCPGGVFASVC